MMQQPQPMQAPQMQAGLGAIPQAQPQMAPMQPSAVPPGKIEQFQNMLPAMGDPELTALAKNPAYAQEPLLFPLIHDEIVRRASMRQQQALQMQAQQQQGQPPTEVQKTAQMADQLAMADTGISSLNPENVVSSASGGIVSLAEGGDVDYSEADATLADGGIVALAGGGDFDYDYSEGDDTLAGGEGLDLGRVNSIFEAEGLTPTQRRVAKAILMQESDFGRNTKTSVSDARGPGQVLPGTFKTFAKPGERIDDPYHNVAAASRYIKHLGGLSKDDPERIAVGYFSGEGNIGTDTPWKRDIADPTGKRTSAYAKDVLRRYTGDEAPVSASADNPAPSAGLEALARDLDDAKESERAARELMRGYGARQRKQRPDEFAVLEQALTDAQKAQAEILPKYQAALKQEQPNIYGPITAPLTPKTTVQTPIGRQHEYSSKEDRARIGGPDYVKPTKPKPPTEEELAEAGAAEDAFFGATYGSQMPSAEPAAPAAPKPEQLLKEIKAAVPAEKRKGLSDLALLQLFAGLGAGRSRHFMRNFSTAMQDAVKTELAVRKEEGDTEKDKALIQYYDALRLQATKDPELVRTLKALGNGDIQKGMKLYAQMKQESSASLSPAALRDKAVDNLNNRLKNNMGEQLRVANDPAHREKLLQEEIQLLMRGMPGAGGGGGKVSFLGYE